MTKIYAYMALALAGLLAGAALIAMFIGDVRDADMLVYTYRPMRGDHHEMRLLDLETGDSFRISTLANVTHASPRWSPDGDTVAFTAQVGSSIHVYTIYLPDRTLRQWSTSDEDGVRANYAMFRDPKWTDDGCCVIFHENRGINENRRFFLADVAAETVIELDLNDARVQAYLLTLVPLRYFSPDGQRVLDLGFGDRHFTLYIGAAHDDGVDYANSLYPLFRAPEGNEIPADSIRWSPDSAKAIFVVEQVDPVIYIMEAIAGAVPIAVTAGSAPDWRP